MIQKETFDEILQMFKGKEIERVYLNEPFYIDENAIASDAIAMVWFNKSLASPVVELQEDKRSGVLKNIDRCVPNDELIISVKELEEVIAKCPTKKELMQDGEDIECEFCKGQGEVEWTLDYKGKKHYKYFDCPHCNGSGLEQEARMIPTGKLVVDKMYSIKIIRSWFATPQIARLLKVAKMLGEDSITLFYQYELSYTGISAFRIGDKVKALVMPVYQSDEALVIHSFQKPE